MNLIDGLFGNAGMAMLENSMRFTEARHRKLLDNIANAETPGYRRKDLSPERFNEALRNAFKSDPFKPGIGYRQLAMEQFQAAGGPSTILKRLDGARSGPQGALRHDGNNVDIDNEMAALVMNASRFNQAINLLKKQYTTIGMAIAERATA